jgi:hypothetical protein
MAIISDFAVYAINDGFIRRRTTTIESKPTSARAHIGLSAKELVSKVVLGKNHEALKILRLYLLLMPSVCVGIFIGVLDPSSMRHQLVPPTVISSSFVVCPGPGSVSAASVIALYSKKSSTCSIKGSLFGCGKKYLTTIV